MAIKLSKAERAEKELHLTTLKEKWEAVEAAKTEAQTAVTLAFTKLNEAIKDFNGAKDDADGWRDDIASNLRSEYDEKSETWQEGDKGQSASSFIEEWEGVDNSDADEVDAPDLDDLMPEISFIEVFEGLPEEPEEA